MPHKRSGKSRDAADGHGSRRSEGNAALTAREAEVLTWVAQGKSAWEVGEILHIAKRTVDEHVRTAVQKLGAVNLTHAVAIALRNRMIDVDL